MRKQIQLQRKTNLYRSDDEDEIEEIEVPKGLININIPLDPQEFYNDFGLLLHPKTGYDVPNLTDYQYSIWNDKYTHKYRLILKSQKVGITTSTLLEDFQDAITRYRGKDILIISQTQYHSNEHLRTLKNLILNSDKYRQYLITHPSEMLLKEEKTKVGVAYIKNPQNIYRPTRIIALGATEGGVWSWKNVAKIHMSDIAAAQIVDDSGLFAAAFSRLANTDGSLIIETPPRGARGHVYEIFEQIQKGESEFQLHTVKASQAVKAGLISGEFLIAERKRLGPLYPQYYEAEFLEGMGNLFNVVSIDNAVLRGREYDPLEFNPNTEKYIVADQGYSTSKFVIMVGEWNRYYQQIRILHDEELQSPLFEVARDRVLELRKFYGNVQNIAFDATSRQEFGMSLKEKIGELSYWPKVKEKMADSVKKGYKLAHRMIVVPIIFNTESKLLMSNHTNQILDDSKGLVAINPKFSQLITSLKGAIFDERGMLDKEASPHNDHLDCFMMLNMFFEYKQK